MILNSPHFSLFSFLELAYKVKARPHLNQAKWERSMLLNVHFLSAWFSWMMVNTLSLHDALPIYASLEWWWALFLSLISWLWRFSFWVDVIFIYFWGGYVTFRRMKHEAMQDVGEVDSPLIFVPLPVRISQRFVDTGNSSVFPSYHKDAKGSMWGFP